MKYLLKKVLLILFLYMFFPFIASATPFDYETCNLGWKHVRHKHNESSYQQAWCKLNNGIEEFENDDYTRIDCLTDEYAVEFDFANKWAESVGQALHYAIMSNKKPKIVLILENSEKQKIYFYRLKKIGKKYNINIEYVTNRILNLDNKEKCSNPKCKCHNLNN